MMALFTLPLSNVITFLRLFCTLAPTDIDVVLMHPYMSLEVYVILISQVTKSSLGIFIV